MSEVQIWGKTRDFNDVHLMRKFDLQKSILQPLSPATWLCVTLLESVGVPRIVFLFLAITYDYKFNDLLRWK